MCIASVFISLNQKLSKTPKQQLRSDPEPANASLAQAKHHDALHVLYSTYGFFPIVSGKRLEFLL